MHNVKEFVTQTFGFSDIRVLTDDDKNDGSPTMANLIESMRWLVDGAKKGDSLFFHYSGHGGTSKDVAPDTDEADGQDETLVPVDYETAGQLVDDKIHEIMVKALPPGVRLTCVMDCCHSGSVFDLPYTYSIDGSLVIHEKDNRKAYIKVSLRASVLRRADSGAGGLPAVRLYLFACLPWGSVLFAVEPVSPNPSSLRFAPQPLLQQMALEAGMTLVKGNKSEAMSMGMKAIKGYMSGGKGQTDDEAKKRQIQIRSTLADVIQFSGCRDDQTSADANINNDFTGAMSWALLKALREHGNNQTYVDLLKNLRANLEGKYTQVPQMSTGHQMNMKTSFGM